MDELKPEQQAGQSNGAVSEAGEGQGGFNTAHFIKFVLLFLIFITVGFLILVGRAWYQGYQEKQESAERVRQAMEMEQRYVDAMTQDTYGGTTPEETLKLFIEALRAEDVELAAKYFMLDEDLTRGKWTEGLSQAKTEGRINEILELLQLERISDDEHIVDQANDAKYVIVQRGQSKGYINMQRNTYSGIWKIESI